MRISDWSSDVCSSDLTDRPGTLSNDFFVNLLDMGTAWKEVEGQKDIFTGTCRRSNEQKWTGTRVDLVFGSNAQLRSEEHTSELQSLMRISYAVFCLNKKK